MKENSGVIFPTGTKADYYNRWYIASRFLEKRSPTWYHSGDDFNLKTGGNSDQGEPLVAIADGEILTTRYKDSGFGNTLTMKFLFEGKVYYALYAHLEGFDTTPGARVKKGEQICRLGNTGNSVYSHLHFSIKNTANGIDNIPNTLEEAKEWEDPLQFILSNYNENTENGGSSEPESTDMLLEYLKVDNEEVAKSKLKEHLGEIDGKCAWGTGDKTGGFLGSERAKNQELKDEIADLEKQVSNYAENEQKMAKEIEDLVLEVDSLRGELENCEGSEKEDLFQDLLLEVEEEMVKSGAKIKVNEDGEQSLEVSFKLK